MKTFVSCFLTIILICVFGCKTGRKNIPDSSSTIKTDSCSIYHPNNIIADTIIYDVIIKNPNPYDTWTNQCLQHLKRKEFIDQLFESIYKEEIKAFDIVTQNPLTSNDIKRLEKNGDFSRDKIGKIQFTETWYYDSMHQHIFKKILSVSLGYEVADSNGEIFAYRPVFKVFYD